jgi:hypothetical protein
MPYYAPKPPVLWKPLLSSVVMRLAFPPLLIVDALKATATYFYGETMGERILQPNNEEFSNISLPKELSEGVVLEQDSIITHDQTVLDTLIISHPDANKKPRSEQLCIINFVGLGMCYQDITREMKEDALALRCKVVGFNYRGIHTSQTKNAKTLDDLVVDGIAQVQHVLSYLNDSSTNPNIILKAHSFGGVVATRVLSHFALRGIQLTIFDGRSLASVSQFFAQAEMIAEPNTNLQKSKNQLIKFKYATQFFLTGWYADVTTEFHAIPDDNKRYIVVRSPREFRQNIKRKHIDDPVIPYEFSLHRSLRQIVKQQGEQKPNKSRENKFYTEFHGSNGHCAPLADLKSRTNPSKTALTFFHEFAQGIVEHHSEQDSQLTPPKPKNQ